MADEKRKFQSMDFATRLANEQVEKKSTFKASHTGNLSITFDPSKKKRDGKRGEGRFSKSTEQPETGRRRATTHMGIQKKRR